MQTLTDRPTESPASDAAEEHFSERRERAPRRPVSFFASLRRHVRLLWPIPAMAVIVWALATDHWVILRALVSISFNLLTIAVAIKLPVNIFAMTRRVVADTVPRYRLKSAPMVVLRWASCVVGLLLSIAFVGLFLLMLFAAGLQASME